MYVLFLLILALQNQITQIQLLMKKTLLTLSIFAFILTSFSQQVVREKVIIENGTGTWCGWCPSAHQGIEDLINAGCEVAPIAYHSGDVFETPQSAARISYYGISGFPTSIFDGVIEEVGGSTSGTTYNAYLPHYNTRIAIPCDYTYGIYGENTSGNNYSVSLVIDLENGTPPADLTAHLVLTETHIPYSWQGEPYVDYCFREMYPDENGTTVDFAGGDQVIINYSITLDASWDIDYIDLIAFLQVESTKEVVQGSMVSILNMPPLQATAGFSSSSIQPCDGSTVDFYDESMGMVTNWWWTFEGGNPATSTDQNPSVTYDTPGVYNVQQVVYDGVVYDTLLLEDYIDVISTPPMAGTPTGQTELCDGNTGYTYNTTGAQWAVDYTWEITPSNAGTIMGTSTTATLDLDPSYVGPIDITVRGNNACGDGIWSDALQTDVYAHPLPFWMSEGSSYCEGTGGVEVTLDGSESGVDYELYLDGVATGTIVAGTGSAISFGNQMGPGIYSTIGYTDYCDTDMYGTAYIHAVDVPDQAGTPEGSSTGCAGGEDDYTTTGAGDAESYIWVLDPLESGDVIGNTTEAIVEWAVDFSGDASLTVQGVNECGEGTFSDPIIVTVEAAPEPVISGESYVYQNSQHNYSCEYHDGSTYDWYVTGGTITAGQGTHEVTVSWGTPGAGSLSVTETTAAGCIGDAEEFGVDIQPMAIEESFMTNINLYPNPAGESLNIELYSEKDASINIAVVNQVGQVMVDDIIALTNGNNKTTINTSDLPNGYYTLKLIAEDGSQVQQKFVIMK
jgi:PKD repeat protein